MFSQKGNKINPQRLELSFGRRVLINGESDHVDLHVWRWVLSWSEPWVDMQVVTWQLIIVVCEKLPMCKQWCCRCHTLICLGVLEWIIEAVGRSQRWLNQRVYNLACHWQPNGTDDGASCAWMWLCQCQWYWGIEFSEQKWFDWMMICSQLCTWVSRHWMPVSSIS